MIISLPPFVRSNDAAFEIAPIISGRSCSAEQNMTESNTPPLSLSSVLPKSYVKKSSAINVRPLPVLPVLAEPYRSIALFTISLLKSMPTYMSGSAKPASFNDRTIAPCPQPTSNTLPIAPSTSVASTATMHALVIRSCNSGFIRFPTISACVALASADASHVTR